MMMEKRELINQMLKQIQGGKSVAAAYLGISDIKFNNRLYESKGCRFFSVDELLALPSLSQSSLVAEYFPQRSNTLVVPIPEPDTLDNVELHHMGLRSNVKGSAVDELILESIEDDGGIDRKEEEKMIAAHRQHMASRESQVKATLRVYGRKKSDSNKIQDSSKIKPATYQDSRIFLFNKKIKIQSSWSYSSLSFLETQLNS